MLDKYLDFQGGRWMDLESCSSHINLSFSQHDRGSTWSSPELHRSFFYTTRHQLTKRHMEDADFWRKVARLTGPCGVCHKSPYSLSRCTCLMRRIELGDQSNIKATHMSNLNILSGLKREKNCAFRCSLRGMKDAQLAPFPIEQQ